MTRTVEQERNAARPNPVRDGCPCDACDHLRRRYLTGCDCRDCLRLSDGNAPGSDPDLLDLYGRKLLIRGWAGKTDRVEKAYVQAHADWAKASAANARRNLSLGNHRFSARTTASTPETEEWVTPESDGFVRRVLGATRA